jgi:hypothetical protein
VKVEGYPFQDYEVTLIWHDLPTLFDFDQVLDLLAQHEVPEHISSYQPYSPFSINIELRKILATRIVLRWKRNELIVGEQGKWRKL